MKAPRLTTKRLRALQQICFLAEADLQCDQTDPVPTFSAKEASEMRDAMNWVNSMLRHRKEKRNG